MKLSSGVARIPDMLRLDVPVGLAVDGSASNDASNLMEEMRAAYLMHRLQYGAQAPSGYDLLKMATRGSARLLGRKKLGQIATGCAADLFAIRYDRMEMAGAERDEANLFGTVGYHLPADAVWVGGRMTVKDGALTRTDVDTALQAFTDKQAQAILAVGGNDAMALGQALLARLEVLDKIDMDALIAARYKRLMGFGRFKEA